MARWFEDIDYEFEYLNLSQRNLGVEGLLDVVHDLADDNVLKHISLSQNIPLDDWRDPATAEYFFRKLKRYLSKNKTLVALDLAGNHLFHYHPHPSNEHTKLYEIMMTDALLASSVTRVDLSDNGITGFSGRELKGLRHLLQQYMIRGQALICRQSLLNSQGFLTITHCLGIHSSLTYLDISDNFGAIDPQGKPTDEGVNALATAIRHTLTLKTLRVDRNGLRDPHVECIAEALQGMPQFRDLSLQGNQCKHYAMRTVRDTILSHILPAPPHEGFRELSLSYNPIGDDGVEELCEAIRRTSSLSLLRLAGCGLTERGGELLQSAFADNITICAVEIHDNEISAEQEALVFAEVEANDLLRQIEKDFMFISVDDLPSHMYAAVARKLRFLEMETLQNLHNNPSFNRPNSLMRENLHLLCPPPRHHLVAGLREKDQKLQVRLERAKEITRRAEAAKMVFCATMRWYRNLTRDRTLQKMIASANLRMQQQNAYNSEDDNWSYGGVSIGSKSVRSAASKSIN